MVASSRMQVIPGQLPVCDLYRRQFPCWVVTCDQACRRAGFTATVTLQPGLVPAAGDLLQCLPRRRDLPGHLSLVAHHPEIADHLGSVGDRARQVREDAAPVQSTGR